MRGVFHLVMKFTKMRMTKQIKKQKLSGRSPRWAVYYSVEGSCRKRINQSLSPKAKRINPKDSSHQKTVKAL